MKEDKIIIGIKIAVYLREKALAFIGKHDKFRKTALDKMKEFQKETEFPNLVREAAALEAAIMEMYPSKAVTEVPATAASTEVPAPAPPLVRVESGPLVTTLPASQPQRRSERIANRPRITYREYDESDAE